MELFEMGIVNHRHSRSALISMMFLLVSARSVVATVQAPETSVPSSPLPNYEIGKNVSEVSVFAWSKGLDAVQAGQYDRAWQLFASAIKSTPTFAPAWVGAADVYFRIGRFEEAAGSAAKAIEFDPCNPQGYLILGFANVKLSKKTPDFTKDFRRCDQKDKGQSRALLEYLKDANKKMDAIKKEKE